MGHLVSPDGRLADSLVLSVALTRWSLFMEAAMAEKCQRCAKKSTKKFDVLGGKELAVNVPLPLV